MAARLPGWNRSRCGRMGVMFDFEKHRTEKENPIMSVHPAVFLLGLRRSGTSIARECMNASPDIGLLFEPRDVWWSITQGHLKRFKDCDAACSPALFFDSLMLQGHMHSELRGAKFAFEPGIGAMYWRHIELRFKGAKFVFVKRNAIDTYASYYANDSNSVQGVTTQSAFNSIHDQVYESFDDFAQQFPRRCAFIKYEDLVAEKKLPQKVWDLLGVEPVDVSGMIRIPRNTQGMRHAV